MDLFTKEEQVINVVEEHEVTAYPFRDRGIEEYIFKMNEDNRNVKETFCEMYKRINNIKLNGQAKIN